MGTMVEVTTVQSATYEIIERRTAYNDDAQAMIELTIHGSRQDDVSPLEYRVRYWARRGRAVAARRSRRPLRSPEAARKTADPIWASLVDWLRGGRPCRA